MIYFIDINLQPFRVKTPKDTAVVSGVWKVFW